MFYLFVKGGNDNLNQLRRETMFVELLENIDPEDAKLLAAIKDKKMPEGYEGLDEKHVKKAFPDLY